MKKLLLLSAALLTATCAFAQAEGTDVTPKNYKFNTATALPFCTEGFLVETDHPSQGGNCPSTGGKQAGVWENLEALGWASQYNEGLIIDASAGQKQANFDNMMEGIQLVDLGGEVGQVFAFIGGNPNVLDYMKTYYLTDGQLDNAKAAKTGIAGWNFNVFSDPKNTPTAADGFIRIRMVLNAFHCDYDNAGNVFNNIYMADNQGNNKITITEDNKVDDATATNQPISAMAFTAIDENGAPVENEYDGGYTWDPSLWMVYEWDINVPAPDSNGLLGAPFRVKAIVPGSNALNDVALFIKEISFTAYPGTPEILGTRQKTFVNYTPGKVQGISDAIAPVKEDGRIFNLQGIEVSNTTVPGIYIQNGKKFIVK